MSRTHRAAGAAHGRGHHADGWQRATQDEDVFADHARTPMMHDVTAGGPGLVAVGRDDGRAAAAVWTSLDGVRWERVAHDEAVLGGDAEMRSVTVGGPGLVAVGNGENRKVAAVWVSVDGQTWKRIVHDQSDFDGPGGREMESVTAIETGLVAVGVDWHRTSAAVWWSPDGRDWQRVTRDLPAFSGQRRQWMESVTAAGPGVVAVGHDEDRQAAAIWVSVDGLTWQRITHDQDVFGGNTELRSVTAGGPGLVAAGHDFNRDAPAFWTSADGLTWQRTTHDEHVFSKRTELRSVTAGGPGLVAVGHDFRLDAAALWTSVDGLTWQRVTHDEDVFGSSKDPQDMWSVVVGGPGLVAVGGSWRNRVTAWYWTPPETPDT